MANIKYPLRTLGGVRSGQGNLPEKIDPTENCCRQLLKNHCPCILEGCLPTKPILSAFHLQGLKSNIYVRFQVVSKQLIGISSRK